MQDKLKIPAVIRDNFRFGTLSFLFVLVYVNVFQFIFGAENSIVGVIFIILMFSSMARDLTATPIRHLFAQAFVLVWMAIAASLATILPAPYSFAINFITILGILYAFTYEYSTHLYFPYILSYLFLEFIAPVGTDLLPKRVLGMLAGAVSIMLYQMIMGRKRVAETARDVLNEMIDDVNSAISYRLTQEGNTPDLTNTRKKLHRLSQTVYDRRKKILCISDASFSIIDAGRGLENLMLLVNELPAPLSDEKRALLASIEGVLKQFHDFLCQETAELPEIGPLCPGDTLNPRTVKLFSNDLGYIRDRLLHMTDPKRKIRYRKTALSLKLQLQAALDFSPVRGIYALRIALLLAFGALLVHHFALPHGRWLMFTMASVSLPYADDVPVKMKKRILATLIGGAISVVIYTLIPSPIGRTAAMMLSGYLSFYFTDYTQTFACSTVGALGGAIFMDTFGLQAVGSMFLIRICYIIVGAVAAYIINCLLFPYTRAQATKKLLERYETVTGLLTRICHSEDLDTQLYYNLIIQAYMLEEKLSSNATLEKWHDLPALLAKYREKVRQAHRIHIKEWKNAPIFEPRRLLSE